MRRAHLSRPGTAKAERSLLRKPRRLRRLTDAEFLGLHQRNKLGRLPPDLADALHLSSFGAGRFRRLLNRLAGFWASVARRYSRTMMLCPSLGLPGEGFSIKDCIDERTALLH
jgi:hypothetical protein